jgi:hypothetical protein
MSHMRGSPGTVCFAAAAGQGVQSRIIRPVNRPLKALSAEYALVCLPASSNDRGLSFPFAELTRQCN